MRFRGGAREPVEVAHRSCSACLVHHIAMKIPKRLQWDPVSERFTNDDDANKLLSRAQRESYSTSLPSTSNRL